MEILFAVLILGGLGLAFGLVLAAASKVFYVETDPRLDALNECLPGANCGGCGFAGCGAYAEAVLNGEAPIGACASGGNECAAKMSEIMGVKAEAVTRKVALVKCSGQKTYNEVGEQIGGAKVKGIYEGFKDCLAASKVGGHGPLACKYDAIHVIDGVAKVDVEKCVGCGMCMIACPRKVIGMVEYGTDVIIACNSNAKGAVTARSCTAGCIGCGLCKKICPNDAITIQNNLAVIDYSKCVSCGLCATVCPKHLIADAKIRNDSDPIPAPNKV